MTRHLLVVYDFPPIGGGISRWMAELARRYGADRLAVSTSEQAESEAVDAALPVPVDRIPGGARRLRHLPGLIAWSRRVEMLVRQHDAGFIWCGNLKPAAYPARWARRRLGTPYGILLHGHDLLVLQDRVARYRGKRWAARMLLGSAAVLVTNSRYTGDLCRSILRDIGLHAAEARVRVVPLGADAARFRPGLDTSAVRERYGLPAGGRWLVTVARLTRHKGIDTTIRALASLRSAEPSLRYLAVGSGEQRGELEALARELGVEERIHIVSGVPDADLPALYNLADVYVQVSRRAANYVEGFGIAAVEASACGRPVVAGREGGMGDAVRDGETGLLVDGEDVAAVAGAITTILGDPALAARLGSAGRRAVESCYNWDRVTADLRAIADELAAAHGSVRPPPCPPRYVEPDR